MRQTLYILTISFLLTSCATIATKKSYEMNISTNAKNAKVEILDSTYQLPTTLNVHRSKSDLQIKLITDSTTMDYKIKSSINPAFLFGNLFLMQVIPVAYLIDLTNQKRFYYGKSIFINIDDTNRVIRTPISKFFHDNFSTTHSTAKGEIYLHLSSPFINSFKFKPVNEDTKINSGFWGVSFGLDYCYDKNRFLNLSVSTVLDFFLPFPAPVDISGEYETMSSKYISFSSNYIINRFMLGYGLCYARNTWEYMYYDRFNPPPQTREPIKRQHNAFGFVFPAYIQIMENFKLGVIYRPTFFVPELTNKFRYEHLVSVDFVLKIRIKK